MASDSSCEETRGPVLIARLPGACQRFQVRLAGGDARRQCETAWTRRSGSPPLALGFLLIGEVLWCNNGVTMAAVSVVGPPEAPLPPPEHVVWRLVRNGRELCAVLLAQPDGVELRQILDRRVVLRSQRFFITDVGHAIDDAVTQAREVWLARGWTWIE